MLYTPTKNPKEAMILVTTIIGIGIAAGYLINDIFLVIALIFWIQYTVVLSYLQFKRKTKHSYSNFTDVLLHPQIRFFIFMFIALLGLGTLIAYDTKHVAAITLAAWWVFSFNFYAYYTHKHGKRTNAEKIFLD